MTQKAAKIKKPDLSSYPLGKGHTHDLLRMKSTPVVSMCSPGTMVELTSEPDRGTSRMLEVFPMLCGELGLPPKEGWKWGIKTNDFISIEDTTLLGEEVHVIGPLKGVSYFYNEGKLSSEMVRFDDASYGRISLPIGTVGMVLSSVVVIPDRKFYGKEEKINNKTLWLARNFYIVFVSTILDIAKGGFYLWPGDEVRRFDSTKKIGINNFDIWNIHESRKKIRL